MNQSILSFVEELKSKSEVMGIILFGSWARGDNRPDSSADLVVILSDGYKRTLDYKDQQVFEIIYITKELALEYWKHHRDDCFILWEGANILYDKDGSVKQLHKDVNSILLEGKKPVEKLNRERLLFDAQDKIKVASLLMDRNPLAASFILTNKVMSLTETFFDLRRLWISPPRQRLEKIKEMNAELYSSLQSFYKDGATMKEKIEFAGRIVDLVFKA